MKLRFRDNSLRLRLNQKEVQQLASGEALTERIYFPGNSDLSYILKSDAGADPHAFYSNGSIQIAAPRKLVSEWAHSEEVGLYFTLATTAEPLKVAIEKDLECIDGPVEERDPDAFPRTYSEKVC